MTQDLSLLLLTAASIGFFHTLMGPDHYVPFIVIAKAKNWSKQKTFWMTTLCGIGHVGSSVLLGFLGISLGMALEKLEWIEASRGNWAAWGLLVFGFLYFLYGIRQAIKNKPHSPIHFHEDGSTHTHTHDHHRDHAHVHESTQMFSIVPWTLFLIFVFGPCEPLIPLIMYPAAQHDFTAVFWVAGLFSLVTISTMLSMVFLAAFGLELLPLKKMQRYSHALAGLSIFLCGAAIQFLGL